MGWNWVTWLSWDLPSVHSMLLWVAAPTCIIRQLLITLHGHRSEIAGFGMCSDFSLRGSSRPSIQTPCCVGGRWKIGEREWLVFVHTADEPGMGYDWNPGLLKLLLISFLDFMRLTISTLWLAVATAVGQKPLCQNCWCPWLISYE